MEALALRRLDRLTWALVALTAACVLAAPLVSRFRIVWDTFLGPGIACALLIAGGLIYRHWRKDARLASGLTSSAQVIAFAAVGAPLSYLAAALGAGLPLYDHAFDTIDRAMGFDWKALLAAMNAAPLLYAPLRLSYLSLTLQMTTVVLCLAYSGRLVWLRVYTLAFILAALASIAMAALLPAAGVWPHYGLTAADSPVIVPAVSTSWPVFYGLRDGSFRDLVAVGSEGIITFPSLHAALAVVLIAGLWPVPKLRWIALVLNLLMLAGTPIDGSHYLVDVIAGIVLAALSIGAAQLIAHRAGMKPSQSAVPLGKIPQLAASE
jgi:membrane-associated phospholipid phosphatase